MKKYLKPKFLPFYALAACLLGFALRLWTLGGGPDDRGLYPPQTFAWVLLWLLTAGLAAGIIYMTRRLTVPGSYGDNFPPSLLGAVGGFLGAAGIMFSGIKALTAQTHGMDLAVGILGIVAAVALLVTALNRYSGKKSGFLFHTLPCLFFALRVFNACRLWSTEPQMNKFLFPFLASITVMLAGYQLAAFDVKMGKRRDLLFWSLMASYICCLALPLCDEPMFYASMAIWLMTNLCSLRPMKKKEIQEPAPEAVVPAEASPDQAPAQPEEPISDQ